MAFSMAKKAARDAGKAAERPSSANLLVTAQILNFEPGTYTIELGSQDMQLGPAGFTTPCVRIDTLHQPGKTANAFFSVLAETNLITPGGEPAFMRVTGAGTVSALLTVYRFESMPAPEVRVRLLEKNGAGSTVADVEPQPPPQTQAEARGSLLVHIEGVGDRSVAIGSWGGTPGSGRTIEGFALRTEPGLLASGIEYQAALGVEWDTPWFPAEEFCGSRGMMLPLLGVRFRLRDAGVEPLVCRYWGSFVGLGERGPFEQGALCACNGAPLEALRIELVAPAKSPKTGTRARRSVLNNEH